MTTLQNKKKEMAKKIEVKHEKSEQLHKMTSIDGKKTVFTGKGGFAKNFPFK